MKARLLDDARFPEIDEAGWRALAQKAVGEADVDEALSTTADDGFLIRPIEPRRTDVAATARSRREAGWLALQRVDDPDPKRANRQAREDVEAGAQGLSIVFDGAPNAFGYGLPATREALAAALDGIPIMKTHLRLDVHPASRQSLDWMVEILAAQRHDPTRLSLSFGIDPAAMFAASGRLRMSIEALRASMPQSLAHFFALGVPGVLLEADGRPYHNAGATEAQELGAMLSAAVSHLRMFETARQPLVYAAPHVGFALSADQNQLMTMAKIRALRRLWNRVQEACSVPASACVVHAETSWRMMTRLDPETNILRATVATFAAATGGADSISVVPHTMTHGLPGPFGRRLARNLQRILADESHIGFVEDPAAGSGSVEAVTDALCEKAWSEFQTLETEGGILDSLAADRFQARVEEAARRRAAEYESGRRVIVGTTLFPAGNERPVETLPADKHPMPTDGTVFCRPLAMRRLDEAAARSEEPA
ncbi:MAG: methylmalonyl-CoA mutase [Rhizobiaceae bacterium]|nr:methylmalonyl-CoA mutase [Rhizobiaceae bacterium]MCV0405537.1 methylmalonyl-CoA mutase [Rhizobiaceae bacterium]